MAENILNLEYLHELVEQELDNAIKFIEREKKKRIKNEKIRKKLEKQANEIGMTLKPREPLPVAAIVEQLSESPTEEEQDEHPHVAGEVYRHPTDASLVWTAQPGRKPNWLTQLLREGHKLEDLKVKSTASPEPAMFSLGDYGH
jgi:DNA-binding protein H-NS